MELENMNNGEHPGGLQPPSQAVDPASRIPSWTGVFGYHDIPLSVQIGDLKVEIKPSGGLLNYSRTGVSGDYTTSLISKQKQVLVCPVESVNTPKMLSPHLLIEFAAPLTIEPKFKRDIFITFPLEIGFFFKGGEEPRCVDIVSLSCQRFTLYGPPSTGTLCRYWLSEIMSSPPPAGSNSEGVLRLTVNNLTSHWSEITQVVLDAAAMRIFYDSEQVMAGAVLKITGSTTGETSFVEHPPAKGMHKAIKLFTGRKIPGAPRHYDMNEGF